MDRNSLRGLLASLADKNGDGIIDFHEAHTIAFLNPHLPVPMPVILDAIMGGRADTNHDGVVTVDEFVDYVTTHY